VTTSLFSSFDWQDALDMSLSEIARVLGPALQQQQGQSTGRTSAAPHPVGSGSTPFSSASYAQLHMMRAYGHAAGQVEIGCSALLLSVIHSLISAVYSISCRPVVLHQYAAVVLHTIHS
jgi:hypothetical protein